MNERNLKYNLVYLLNWSGNYKSNINNQHSLRLCPRIETAYILQLFT